MWVAVGFSDLRPISYAKTIIQISEFYFKGFKGYPHSSYHYFPVPGECFSSLVLIDYLFK